MRFSRKRCGIGLLAGASIAFVLLTQPTQAQTTAPAANLVDQLVGPETPADIDVPALRQQAVDRVKSKADATALKRPPVAPQLLKLPQFSFDVAFDPDSSVIRPQSYQTIGRIADALSDLKLLHYTFLVIDHTEAAGRRDANLTLSQRRADAIREALVGAFKISPKRLQALGLGEEQLQDFLPSGIAGQCQGTDCDDWGSRCCGSKPADGARRSAGEERPGHCIEEAPLNQ